MINTLWYQRKKKKKKRSNILLDVNDKITLLMVDYVSLHVANASKRWSSLFLHPHPLLFLDAVADVQKCVISIKHLFT